MSKKLFAVLAASASLLMLCTACGSSEAESSAEETTTAPVTTAATEEAPAETAAPVVAEDVEFEEAVEAGSGDAILAITDGQWYVQYWGTKDDLLTYDAKIAHIDGDGDYTVGVNVGTKGAQFDITGDPANGYTCGGVDFAAIKVFDGTTLYPNMSIEIKEIRVDGKPIEMTAKNYTSSDDGTEMRSNIYNHFVSKFPDDAHTADGAVTGEFGEYSSMIINPDDVASWTTIEVDFTVTGTGDGAPAEGEDSEAAESAAETGAAETDAAETSEAAAG